MTPLHVDLPHKLGREGARARLAASTDRLQSFFPSGTNVRSNWTGDRLDLTVEALGQSVRAQVDVEESKVRVAVVLPAALGFFSRAIEAAVKKGGTELLEDRTTRS